MRKSSVNSTLAHRTLSLLGGSILLLADLRAGPASARPAAVEPFHLAVASADLGPTIDPARPSREDERTLARNLYGRLLEYNEDGELVPGIPVAFEWQGRTLVFIFGTKVSTPKGHVITATEAARSLKRTVMLHSNLLCNEGVVHSLDDTCDGIAVVDRELRLTPKPGISGARLTAALVSTEYSIVPGPALGTDPRALEILNPTETSGPYRLSLHAFPGRLRLSANAEHYLYDERMPAVVEVSPEFNGTDPAWTLPAETDAPDLEFWKVKRRR